MLPIMLIARMFKKDIFILFPPRAILATNESRYIDNIIRVGLVITESDNNELYIKCNCNNSNNIFIDLLKNLSDALQYIINDDITLHSNFIHDSLYNWAEKLYDKMSWKIK